jgi:hypothetical protein
MRDPIQELNEFNSYAPVTMLAMGVLQVQQAGDEPWGRGRAAA